MQDRVDYYYNADIDGMSMKEALEAIDEIMIQKVLEFLRSGNFENKNANAYMRVYSIVHKKADDEGDSSRSLFNYYIKTLTTYMTEAKDRIATEKGEKLIDMFLHENIQTKILTHWMRKIFTYLDKFYTKNTQTAPIGTLFLNGLRLYKDNLFSPLKNELFKALNQMIRNDRECQIVDRTKIRRMLKIIEDVDIKNPELNRANDQYFWSGDSTNLTLKDWFAVFKADTKNYINEKSKREIAKLSAPEYTRSCLKFLEEEKQRCDEYIYKDFHTDINTINFKYMIEENAKELCKMDTGVKYMFNNKKENELKEVFTLILNHSDSLKFITLEMDPFIRERGESLFQNKDLSKDPIKFVPELIKLKKEMDHLVEFSFSNHILFQDTKNKAFSFFMNKDFYSIQLANFCDFEFRRGIKGLNENQIDERLNNIINIFKCLNNRLKFQLEYSKKLSDRLISNSTISAIAEESLISKLKAEAGVAFVTKMTAMMQDLKNSKVEMDLFKQQGHRGRPAGIDIMVQVLGNSSWDIEKVKFERLTNLPKAISSSIDEFNNFYVNRRKMHRLDWVFGIGTLEFQMVPKVFWTTTKNITPISSLVQYLILSTLERHEKLSIQKITELLGHSQAAYIANEANFLLYNPGFNPTKSLTAGIISTNAPEKKDLEPNHEIWLNKDFNPNNAKPVMVPTIMRKSGPEAPSDFNEKQYKNMILDANITRIMKGRIGQKTTHAFLVAEVAKQIDLFIAQPPMVKERIESLIDKQILKRADNDRNCYEYVA